MGGGGGNTGHGTIHAYRKMQVKIYREQDITICTSYFLALCSYIVQCLRKGKIIFLQQYLRVNLA